MLNWLKRLLGRDGDDGDDDLPRIKRPYACMKCKSPMPSVYTRHVVSADPSWCVCGNCKKVVCPDCAVARGEALSFKTCPECDEGLEFPHPQMFA